MKVLRSSPGHVCRASKGDRFAGVKEFIDSTKVPLTRDDILENQENNASEKQSVVGTTPPPGTTIPRAEVDRRPELGNTSFGSIMAFDGPGPETINGRLAMLGCAWGLISELTTGQRIVDQVNYAGSPGLFWLVTSANVLILASLIPIFNGESTDSRKNGPFTAKAERWNGRLAMIGFAGILIWEFIFGRALFHF